MSRWDTINESLKAGEDPAIVLSDAELWIKPKGKPGRPKLPPKAPFSTYLAGMLSGWKKRPRCLNPKCSKRLKSADNLACCENCRLNAIIYLKMALLMLRRGAFSKPQPIKDVPIAYNNYERAMVGEPEAGTSLGNPRASRKRSIPKFAKGFKAFADRT